MLDLRWWAIVLAVACGVVYAAKSEEAPELGTGLFCDTPDQVKAVIENERGGMPFMSAMNKVNGDTNACAYQPIIYIRGDPVGEENTSNGLLDIVKITVIGFVDEMGLPHQLEPQTQYAAFAAKGQGI